MYYDPFANLDPDLIKPFKPAEKPEPPAINPEATEFHPSAQCVSEKLENISEQQQQKQCPEGVWQIVASEEGGRAVAVMVSSEGLLACSSPAFLSSCSHPGVPCMAWDTFLQDQEGLGSLASDSPQPDWGQNFTDSGFENGYENGYDAFTDNSSEQSGEGLLLAEAPPYVSELSFTREQYCAPAPLHVYPAPGPGEGYTCRGGELPQGFTKSLPEAIALAPDTVVVEHYPSTTGDHYPAPLVVQEQQYESWGSHDHSSPISWSAGLGLNIPSLDSEASPSYSPSTYPASTYSDPAATFTSLGYPALEADPLSPTGQTQFIHLGGLPALHSDMAALSLGERRREKTEEERLLDREEKRKREEFKKKVLYNLSGSSEEREEMKIRDTFKDQVLSNLRKEQQQKESEEQKIKRAFKDKIISNLSAPSVKS